MLKRLKKQVKTKIPDTVEETMQGSKGFPETKFVGSLRERRLMMALRSVSFALVMAMFAVIIEGFLLVSLMPLKEIRPFLVQVAEEGTVVASIKPIQDSFEAKDVLTEKLVREYVVSRHEILRSNSVMTNRWSQAGYMGVTTEKDEYRRFRNSVTKTLEAIRSADATRRATILSVSAVRTGQVYVVDFRSTSYDQNNFVVDERVYTATVEITFKELSNMTREQMLINPTGFTVVSYSLAEKDQ